MQRSVTRAMLLASLLIAVTVPATRNAKAFRGNTYTNLTGIATSIWVFHDYIDSQLGIYNSGRYSLRALNQWDSAAWFTIFDIQSGGSPNTQTNHVIYPTNFNIPFQASCGNLFTVRGTPSAACPDVAVFLNSSYGYHWNTTGDMTTSNTFDARCLCYPKNQDYVTSVLHELGHVWGLFHPSSSVSLRPVMFVEKTVAKPKLFDDDKNGATQYFGPDTGWEMLADPLDPSFTFTQTMGHADLPAYGGGVSSAQLRPVSAQLSVTPYKGSRMLKLYGVATNSYSNVYMKLFTGNDDELGIPQKWVTVQNGTILQWFQYNSSQGTMSVDILFTDGTTLRDSGVKDQNNVRVHPAYRGVYAAGSWFFVKVNLSSLAGKTIKDIMVGYDNGSNGVTGTIRGYFDELAITHP